MSAADQPESGVKKRCWPWRHKWSDAGAVGLMFPVERCTRCGWWRVFSGYAVTIYPPHAVRQEADHG